ncbi:hematopoietic SH2 domain-containing protein homolog [Silurus meridionalis]|uniref:SH2 domain-containing protein n=2 Tax=Silurus TaxID=94992 RepID=A0A8T0B859_SILME|nr:hematopoietic SH2 domain-containing protein homolog [Silurus meridionalis]KAF7703081.1 hypothetical protein HF521_022088 [Silurus meridionalis]
MLLMNICVCFRHAVRCSRVMAEAVTPYPLIAWFAEFQKNQIMKDGVIPKWFHGFISRKLSEELLMTKPQGYFLIRISESRIGYTLSYRSVDVCRHFMIDMLPGNQYEIVGENLRHPSLHDLVAYYQRTPIYPFSELLTVACDQADQNISEDTPPALPVYRRVSHPPIRNQDLSIPLDGSFPPRLYPSLELELSAVKLDSMSSLNTASQTKPKSILTPQEINSRWRSAIAKTIMGERSTRLPTDWDKRRSEDKVVPKSEMKHARLGLIQCRNIFKKKKNLPEEPMYMEINEAKVAEKPAELQIDEEKNYQEFDGVFETLPLEYLNPPPFAPGH